MGTFFGVLLRGFYSIWGYVLREIPQWVLGFRVFGFRVWGFGVLGLQGLGF